MVNTAAASKRRRTSEVSVQRLTTQQTLAKSLTSNKSMRQTTNGSIRNPVTFIKNLPKEVLSSIPKNDFDVSESNIIQIKESDDLTDRLQCVLQDETAWQKKKKRRR